MGMLLLFVCVLALVLIDVPIAVALGIVALTAMGGVVGRLAKQWTVRDVSFR